MPAPEHRAVFEPSEEYIENLEYALSVIFDDIFDRNPLQDGFTKTCMWRTDTYVFSVLEKQEFIAGAELQTQPSRYYVMRSEQVDDDLIELRTYDYRSGSLQVSTTFKTVANVETNSEYEQLAEGIYSLEAELHNGIHTPADIEYLDFLADISSFEDAIEIYE